MYSLAAIRAGQKRAAQPVPAVDRLDTRHRACAAPLRQLAVDPSEHYLVGVFNTDVVAIWRRGAST